MYDYLQRSDAILKKPGSMAKAHPRAEGTQERKALLKGYEPSDNEKKKNKSFFQNMSLENSFGNIRLGVNTEGEMLLIVSGKKDMKENLPSLSSKRLNGNRAIEKADGLFAENDRNPLGAVAYRGEIKTRRQRERMLARLREMLLEDGKGRPVNDTVQSQLPFLFVERDKDELKKLNEMSAGHEGRCVEGKAIMGTGSRENGGRMYEQAIDRRKSQLHREIQQKQDLKREVMASISAAVSRPALKQDDSVPVWLFRLAGQLLPDESGRSDGQEHPAESDSSDEQENSAENAEGGNQKKKRDKRRL